MNLDPVINSFEVYQWYVEKASLYQAQILVNMLQVYERILAQWRDLQAAKEGSIKHWLYRLISCPALIDVRIVRLLGADRG